MQKSLIKELHFEDFNETEIRPFLQIFLNILDIFGSLCTQSFYSWRRSDLK